MADLTKYNSVLSIAGSDSGGCAGIQADIKSISACGAYAATVITATTAQNTQGVTDIHAIPVSHLESQLDAVLSDIDIDVVKIGMLHSVEVINAVKSKLVEYGVKTIVLDPVMVTTGGDKLITDEAIECLKTFLPMATIITPNLREADLLLNQTIDIDNMVESAELLSKKYGTSVLLKGGKSAESNEITDVFHEFNSSTSIKLSRTKVDTNNTHGTGCSLSSSIAAYLSKGEHLENAVRKGCDFIHQAIQSGKNKELGKGNGPVNHFGL